MGHYMPLVGRIRPRNFLTNRKGNRPGGEDTHLQTSTQPRHAAQMQTQHCPAFRYHAPDRQRSWLRRLQLATNFARPVNCRRAYHRPRRASNASARAIRQFQSETFARTPQQQRTTLLETCLRKQKHKNRCSTRPGNPSCADRREWNTNSIKKHKYKNARYVASHTQIPHKHGDKNHSQHHCETIGRYPHAAGAGLPAAKSIMRTHCG